uniref:Uncharacterized protein n=1 Tax=Arundo donax TaxID=35708 RepID=A0A0A9GS91_ARUDO
MLEKVSSCGGGVERIAASASASTACAGAVIPPGGFPASALVRRRTVAV